MQKTLKMQTLFAFLIAIIAGIPCTAQAINKTKIAKEVIKKTGIILTAGLLGWATQTGVDGYRSTAGSVKEKSLVALKAMRTATNYGSKLREVIDTFSPQITKGALAQDAGRRLLNLSTNNKTFQAIVALGLAMAFKTELTSLSKKVIAKHKLMTQDLIPEPATIPIEDGVIGSYVDSRDTATIETNVVLQVVPEKTQIYELPKAAGWYFNGTQLYQVLINTVTSFRKTRQFRQGLYRSIKQFKPATKWECSYAQQDGTSRTLKVQQVKEIPTSTRTVPGWYASKTSLVEVTRKAGSKNSQITHHPLAPLARVKPLF